ncbi:MAG: hypothetical protein IPM24_09145 [Bryobacterales bacterium]|nr:hypothetical protein [Bryobacterales bacterium]
MASEIRFTQLAGSTPAESGMPWLPTLASVAAGLFTAALACPAPQTKAFGAVETLLRAVFAVCLAGGASAVAARASFSAFGSAAGGREVALRYAGIGVWFAPLAVFVGGDDPVASAAALVTAVLLGLATARLLRRWETGAGADDWRIPHGRPAFAAVASPGPSPGLHYALAATLAVQAALVLLTNARTGAAVVLAGVAAFLLAASPVLAPAPSRVATPLRRLSLGLGVRAMSAGALAVFGLLPDVTYVAELPEESVRPFKHHRRAPSRGVMDDRDLHAGAILLVEAPRSVVLTAPVPVQRPVLASKPRPRTDAIDFSGEYWIFPSPMQRPPENSLIERATPLTYNFTAVDRSPLIMRARQRLDAPVDLRCCSAIDVAVNNGDKQPGTVALGVSLFLSSLPRGPRQRLGPLPLREAGPAVLRYRIPARPVIGEFDEIVVEYDLRSPRIHRSANVAIESFTLIRRGM